MKKLLVDVFTVGLLSFAATSARAEWRTWCGEGGTEDWSSPDNWVGGNVATGDDTAYFPAKSSEQYGFIHRVTPPASFTGTIVCSNELHEAKRVKSSDWWTAVSPVEVVPQAVEGASWKIDGTGSFVAGDGFASHVPATFKGRLVIPKGVAFTAPADLHANVVLTGAGTLTLASTNQLSQATAFVGDIVLPTDDLSLSNLGSFANAAVRLADGQTVSLSGHDAAYSPVEPIESFVDHPELWTFNGSISTTDDGTRKPDGSAYPEGAYNTLPPYVQDGVLYLTDDPSQGHTVWYTNRLFRSGDEVGMKFTWNPAVPTNPHVEGAGRTSVLSGNFFVGFQGDSPTNCKTGSMGDLRELQATHQQGFYIHTYRGDNPSRPYVGWDVESTYTTSANGIGEKALTIVLNKPIDISVTISKSGLMTVTLEQDGKTETFSKSYSTQISTRTPKGFYVGFSGSSDTWGYSYSSMPWVSHRITNFRGWSRSDFGGNWAELPNASDFAPTASNWYTVQGANDGTTVTNGPNAFAPDGTMQLVSGAGTMSYLFSNVKVDVTRPTKMLIDLSAEEADSGLSGNMGNIGIVYGFIGNNSTTTKPMWDSKGYYGFVATYWLYGDAYTWDMSAAESVNYYMSRKNLMEQITREVLQQAIRKRVSTNSETNLRRRRAYPSR